MKKLWIIPISKGVKYSNKQLYRLNINFNTIKCFDAVKPIDENEYKTSGSSSLYLLNYLPEIALTYLNGYERFEILYSDNKEYIRQKWFMHIINDYEYIKDLEDFTSMSIKIDKRNLRGYFKLLEKIEVHKIKYPELWI